MGVRLEHDAGEFRSYAGRPVTQTRLCIFFEELDSPGRQPIYSDHLAPWRGYIGMGGFGVLRSFANRTMTSLGVFEPKRLQMLESKKTGPTPGRDARELPLLPVRGETSS